MWWPTPRVVSRNPNSGTEANFLDGCSWVSELGVGHRGRSPTATALTEGLPVVLSSFFWHSTF